MEVSPVHATPHVLHAWKAHECSFKGCSNGREMFMYMSPSVRRDSQAYWTSAYKKVQHSRYSTSCTVSLRTAHRFTILHSPASLHLHPASTSLSFNLSPAHLHVCRQGDISYFSFRGCLRLIVLLFVFLAQASLYSLSLFNPFLPAFVRSS